MPTVSELRELVKRAAVEAGFDLAGIAPVKPFSELKYFDEWIAEGRHGDMHYLASRDNDGQLKRSSIEHAAPWARSVIVCAANYNARPLPEQSTDKSGVPAQKGPQHSSGSPNPASNTSGFISRYAWGERDYHDVILPRLRQLEMDLRKVAGDIRTWSYVDTGPVVERVLAKYAGIGWIGKNTCIINQSLGSWLFLGVILTSLELEPDLPPPDRCGTCTRCLHACPTNAFIGPYKLDASRCVSYLTIEKRGDIPEELRDGIENNVFGCDICQNVCPWNADAPVTSEPAFQSRQQLVNVSLEWLATITPEQFAETFRRSPVKRAKRTGMRRNAVVAMGNSGNRQFVPVLRGIIQTDDDPIVKSHAEWALRKLESEEARRRNPPRG